MLDQRGDRVPVGLPGVGLRDGAPVQRDRGARRTPGRSGRRRGRSGGRRRGPCGSSSSPARRTARPRRPRASRISAEQPALPRQRSPAALAGHLGHRAAEVEVDVGDAVLGAEDLGRPCRRRPGRCRRAGPSGRSRARRRPACPGCARRARPARGGDHLADVEPGALLGAQPAVGRVGDARHRREHHGGLDAQRPEGQRRWAGRTWPHCRGRGGDAETVSSVRRPSSAPLPFLSAFFAVGLRGLRDVAGPGDRVEVLGRAEADRRQLALSGAR